MKNLIILSVIALLSICAINAQEEREIIIDDKVAAIVLETDGNFRKNLLLLDFFRKDARFNVNVNFDASSAFARNVSGTGVNAMQQTAYVDSFSLSTGNSNFFKSYSPSVKVIPTNRTMIYIDRELVFGNGENRLDKIIHLRLKDVKSIARVNDFDTKIFVTLMDGAEIRY